MPELLSRRSYANVANTNRRAKKALSPAATTALSVIAFAVALYYAYKTEISPIYSYQGLSYRPPDPVNLVLSGGIAVVAALCLPGTIKHPSHFILWVVFIVAALPAILISQYLTILNPDEATILGVHVASSLGLCRLAAANGPRRLITFSSNFLHEHFWLLVAVFSLGIYTVLVSFVGVHVRYLSFADVYDVRSEFGRSTLNLPIIGYLLPVQYNVLNPMLIAKGIYARRVVPFTFGVGGQILIYMTVGYKSVLLSTFGIFIAAWLLRKKDLSGARMLLAAALGTVGSVVIDKLLGSATITALFVRRFLVVPGVLTVAYVAIFRDLPKLNFSDSIFPFLTNPYEGGLDPTHLAGAIFVGNAETAANVSLFGHGFLSYGYLGMYIEAVALAVALWLVDDASAGLPTRVSSLVFLMPAVAISSASIFTAVLTHGLLAAVLLVALMPRTGWSHGERCRQKTRPSWRNRRPACL